MEHRCSEYAEVDEDSFELVDGHLRGEAEAVCGVCGSVLDYEYALEVVTDREAGEREYVSC